MASNGCHIVVRGSAVVTGGTSARAPLWAGWITLINQQRGRRPGFVKPLLYRNPALLRPVTVGNNMASGTEIGHVATPGWSASTGLGTPLGAELIQALAAGA